MKYLIGVMFLMLAQVASAQLCRVNNGPWMNPLYGEINVNVDFEPGRLQDLSATRLLN